MGYTNAFILSLLGNLLRNILQYVPMSPDYVNTSNILYEDLEDYNFSF